MRRFLIVGITLAVGACKQESAPQPKSAAVAPAPAPAAAPAEATLVSLRGKIAERIDTPQYSYLRLTTASGDQWAAVSKTDKPVGAEVAVVKAAWMENFKSNSMGRTWERIAFGTLDEPGAAPQPSSEMPAGHPQLDPATAKFASATGAGQGSAMHQHPSPAAAADLGKIKVAKAPGAEGRTVADVWARRASLKDKKVAVRGKVVKATLGVMGKNWLHLRDGSGEGQSSDLTVASADVAAVGDTVLVTGVVHLDRDLGAGYHYDVIVEDAQVKAE
jgi:hypothetical protein